MVLPEADEDLKVQLDELELLLGDIKKASDAKKDAGEAADKKDVGEDEESIDNIFVIDKELKQENIVGGDMLFTQDQVRQAMSHNHDGVQGDITTTKSRKWPASGNVVKIPYVYSSGGSNGAVTQRTKVVIDNAIAEYNAKTCIRFVPRSNEADYVRIINGGGCYSYVGKVGGAQDVSLYDKGAGRPSCVATGIVIHEFMHAIGWFHKQSRNDRDQYITVFYENIDSNYAYNFNKMNTNTQGLAYDTESIMHYGSNAFSKNGQPTILKKGGARISGQRNGFTQLDIDGINKYYCQQQPTTKPTTKTTPVQPILPTTPSPLNAVVLPEKSVICPVFHKFGLCKYCFVSDDYCKGYCVDTNTNVGKFCASWANSNYCIYRYTTYMWKNCATSCKTKHGCTKS